MIEQKRAALRLMQMISGINPSKSMIQMGDCVRNAERTSDERAAVGESWREYWQVFSLEDYPLSCPFCGKSLDAGEIDGCHVELFCALTGKWSSKKYIIPGHHGCNMQLGEDFYLEKGVLAVEAIEK